MNERIKELAAAAGYVPIPNAEFANSLNEAFHQKFAELIIRECMEVGNLALTDEYDHLVPSELIAKHFGVE